MISNIIMPFFDKIFVLLFFEMNGPICLLVKKNILPQIFKHGKYYSDLLKRYKEKIEEKKIFCLFQIKI